MGRRLAEAELVRDAGAPEYTVVVALQAAIELYIDEVAKKHAEFGPFSRADNPHERRTETAETLAVCGCIAYEAVILVRDLRKWSGRTRYGDVIPHPTALDHLISLTRSVVQESAEDLPSAA